MFHSESDPIYDIAVFVLNRAVQKSEDLTYFFDDHWVLQQNGASIENGSVSGDSCVIMKTITSFWWIGPIRAGYVSSLYRIHFSMPALSSYIPRTAHQRSQTDVASNDYWLYLYNRTGYANWLAVSEPFGVYNSSAGESVAEVKSLPTTAPPHGPMPIASTSRPSPSASASASIHAGSTGLSTGAKAGIGIGVALGVIAVLALCLYLWRKRRGPHQNTKASTTAAVGREQSPRTYRKPELEGDPGSAQFHYSGKPELAVERDWDRLGHSTAATPGTVNETGDDVEDPARLLSTSAPHHLHRKEPLEQHTNEKELADPSNPIVRPAVATATSAPHTPQTEDTAPKYPVPAATDLSEMRAQEAQLRSEIHAHEDLQKLRDEHAALMGKIRLAEMRLRRGQR